MKKRLLSLFPRLPKSKFGRTPNKNSSSKRFFRHKMRFRARKSSEEKRKTPRKSRFRPKTDRIGRKRAVLGEKSQRGDRAKKRTLLPILPCYEVAKWVQMNFFSHFFFVEVLQGMQKCPTFALAIGKQRSCKRELRSESNEAAKVLL